VRTVLVFALALFPHGTTAQQVGDPTIAGTVTAAETGVDGTVLADAVLFVPLRDRPTPPPQP
jgi:hypothetical protein